MIIKLFLLLLMGECIKNGLSFNPLLTYTIRFHKMTFTLNLTGNYTINQYREFQYINGNIRINSTKLLNKVIVTFQRCNEAVINCEYFQSWSLLDGCKKLREKNQLWSRWYNAFTPRFECPIDKVDYNLRNATVDLGAAFLIYPEASDYGWKLAQDFYSDDTFVGGYTVAASIFGYRKRIKLLKS